MSFDDVSKVMVFDILTSHKCNLIFKYLIFIGNFLLWLLQTLNFTQIWVDYFLMIVLLYAIDEFFLHFVDQLEYILLFSS